MATAGAHLEFRDELLNGEIFHSLAEAKTIVETWQKADIGTGPMAAVLA